MVLIDDEERLLDLLPLDGEPRSNASLMDSLGWTPEQYWPVRDSLVEQGLVTKRRGRGGQTARVLDGDEDSERPKSGALTWLTYVVFALSSGLAIATALYTFVWRDSSNWVWNSLSLAFGAVTTAAVGVSLLIFRAQTEADRVAADDQALILRRLQKVARQAAMNSSDTRDFLREMQRNEASVAAGSLAEERRTGSEAGGQSEDDLISSNPEPDDVYRVDGVEYYRPPAVPLHVLAELVSWWKEEGETGRWDLSNLVGGYRVLNSKGTRQGVPWVLVFKDSAGESHQYRVAYSGQGKGATVSEHKEGLGWQELDSAATGS